MMSAWKFACLGAFHGGLDAHQMLPKAKIHEAAALLQQSAENQPSDFFEEASFAKATENVQPRTDQATLSHVSAAEPTKSFSVMQGDTQQHSGVSARESSCRSFLDTWATR